MFSYNIHRVKNTANQWANPLSMYKKEFSICSWNYVSFFCDLLPLSGFRFAKVSIAKVSILENTSFEQFTARQPCNFDTLIII